MPAIEHRDREHIQNRKVYIEQHEEVQCQPVVGFHPGTEHREDAHRAAQVLYPHTGFFRVK